MVRDRGAAEDITVAAFWRIYKARERFDPGREFGPWARRIATNLALDHLRSQPPEVDLSDELAGVDAPDPGVRAEVAVQIRAALARLPVHLRTVALLALIEDRPYGEIGEALGLTENAVKLRVFRAVRLLRKDLASRGITP
jgi:RNA polymerase sigma-70 factor, ECF subfamily